MLSPSYLIKLVNCLGKQHCGRLKHPTSAAREVQGTHRSQRRDQSSTLRGENTRHHYPSDRTKPWVTSLHIPIKANSLGFAMMPRTLPSHYKGIYKAPALEEIKHRLPSSTIYSKLGARDRFFSTGTPHSLYLTCTWVDSTLHVYPLAYICQKKSYR